MQFSFYLLTYLFTYLLTKETGKLGKKLDVFQVLLFVEILHFFGNFPQKE